MHFPVCMHVACGVAHQALEGIEPKGQDILIQGTIIALVCQVCHIHVQVHAIYSSMATSSSDSTFIFLSFPFSKHKLRA